jgi:hypothetical protein
MLLRETLIHNRLKKILENEELSVDIKLKLDTVRNPLTEAQEALQNVHTDLEVNAEMKMLVDKDYEKPGIDMGDFWLSFLEMTDPLVQCIDACHVCDIQQYLSSTFHMLSGLMAYDNHEYGRWLPDYWAKLFSLPPEQMEFFSDHFAQSMTGLLYSCGLRLQ